MRRGRRARAWRILPAFLSFLALPVGSLAEESSHDQVAPSEVEIGETEIYSTPEDAVREIFQDAVTIDEIVRVLTAEDAARLEKRLGSAPPSDTLLVRVPRDGAGRLLGYAVVAEEVGKYRPITFLVGTGPDRSVLEVEVLVYRESRGGEVRKSRFLRQYRGKTTEDPIRINRDILNIAGATLSVRAMNLGVERVLASLATLAEKGDLPQE